MQNLMDDLKELLAKDNRIFADGILLKNILTELALKLDQPLIELLLSGKKVKENFFIEQNIKNDKVLIFDKDKFISYINNKEFLPDSFTSFKNKIGLISNDEYLKEKNDVVLAWAYKDCILEGGQENEDEKRDEVFFNEILAPDEIDRLLDPKVFTNFKRIDAKGEHAITSINPEDNLIIKGNNLLVLHSLKKMYANRIKLIYIDPPYNTGNDGFGYNDNFNHSTWLTFMKNRLEAAKILMKNDGVIFIQIDDNEQAYLKVLCDEIFGKSNFINCIAVKMSEATSMKMAHAKLRFPKLKEYILFYKKQNFTGFFEIDKYKNPIWDNENNIYLENFSENQRRQLSAMEDKDSNDESDMDSAIKILQDVKKVSLNKKIKEMKFESYDDEVAWKFENAYRIIKTAGAANLAKKIKEMKKIPNQDISAALSNDNILFFYFTDFNRETRDPRFRVIFADTNLYKNPCDFWQDIKTSGAIADEGDVKLNSGKKPEKLLERIIKMTTKKGDLILDFHLGTGTTCAVAHKMGRQYIGIEQLDYEKNDSVIRLKNVIAGDQTGISEFVEWKGGGSFIYTELLMWNEIYIQDIKNSDTSSKLFNIYEKMKKEAFFRYNIDLEKFDEKDFAELPLKDQKKVLCECLDKNHLYVNLSEIDDTTYKVSAEDKKLNKDFYKQSVQV